MATRKPGRPKEVKQLTEKDLFTEDGRPINQNKFSKDQQALTFARSLEPDAQRMNPNKGMYSGMANPQSYLDFYKTAISKKHKGRPWTYPDAQSLQKEVVAYFEFCVERRIPVTVAGLGAWLGITTSTLRNWKQNRDTMPLYEVIEPAISFIHSMTEQGAVDGTVPAISFIFLAKNYFGLKDVQEYTVEARQQLSTSEQDAIIETLPNDD